jgi:hypothetical protein
MSVTYKIDVFCVVSLSDTNSNTCIPLQCNQGSMTEWLSSTQCSNASGQSNSGPGNQPVANDTKRKLPDWMTVASQSNVDAKKRIKKSNLFS